MGRLTNEQLNKWLKIILLVISICVAAYLICYWFVPSAIIILRVVGRLLLPFILAVAITIIIEPAISFLQRKCRLGRGLATIIVILVLLAIIVFISSLLITRLVSEIYLLYDRIPDMPNFIDNFYNNITERIDQIFAFQNGNSNLEAWITSIGEKVTVWTSSVLNNILNSIINFPTFLLLVLVTILATYFFSRDKENILNKIFGLLGENRSFRLHSIYDDMAFALAGYFRVIVILVFISMLIAIVAFLIMGVKYAITLGVLVGLCDILPVLGPGTILLPWVVICLFTGNISRGIGLLVLYLFITVVRQLIQPKMVSKNIGLHPLATLVAIFIGWILWGFLGLFLLPIIAVVLKSIYQANKAVK